MTPSLTADSTHGGSAPAYLTALPAVLSHYSMIGNQANIHASCSSALLKESVFLLSGIILKCQGSTNVHHLHSKYNLYLDAF